MRTRWIAVLAVMAMFVVACDGDDPELSTDSTIITGPTGTGATGTEPPEGTGTTAGNGGGGGSPATTLAGQQVSDYNVVNEIPNDNGVEMHIVIPSGAYTDVDLENFVFTLLEENPDLFGAEIFDQRSAADAFLIPRNQRTEQERTRLQRHWFVSVTGRQRLDFRGPFAGFPGGAIGS